MITFCGKNSDQFDDKELEYACTRCDTLGQLIVAPSFVEGQCANDSEIGVLALNLHNIFLELIDGDIEGGGTPVMKQFLRGQSSVIRKGIVRLACCVGRDILRTWKLRDFADLGCGEKAMRTCARSIKQILTSGGVRVSGEHGCGRRISEADTVTLVKLCADVCIESALPAVIRCPFFMAIMACGPASSLHGDLTLTLDRMQANDSDETRKEISA